MSVPHTHYTSKGMVYDFFIRVVKTYGLKE
jgi:hypothetical protein